MATFAVAYDNAATGGAGQGAVVRGVSGRSLKLITGTITFGTGYPTNGVDISEIWKRFSKQRLLSLFLDSKGSGRLFEVDFAAKKIKVFTTFGTEAANASDQTAAGTTRFLAVGY